MPTQLLQTGFLRVKLKRTLLDLYREIGPFIIGFSFSEWREALVGSLTDGVLADAILIPPRPPIKRR